MAVTNTKMQPSALGGEGWVPRQGSHRENSGPVWAPFGVGAECGRLRSVLLHRPGAELGVVADPRAALWLERLDPERARAQHDDLASLYRRHGVEVRLIDEAPPIYPNLYFLRDTFAMTPEGAILARPAALARAGEERVVAQALARLGVPITLSVHGMGTFEGADLLLVNDGLALIAEGLRTNAQGVRQVAALLRSSGVAEVVRVPLRGCLHLDCAISIIDRHLALVDRRFVPPEALQALRRHGLRALVVPDDEADQQMALNLVALAPGVVVIPAGNPATVALLSRAGVTCLEVDVSELMKGGGAIHCMTGVLVRDGI